MLMNTHARLILLPVALAISARVWCEESRFERLKLSEPPWHGKIVHGESLLFLEEEPDAQPSASLLFEPLEIVNVVHPSSGRQFKEGQDFTVETNSRRIRLTPNSPIPRTSYIEFRPPVGGSGQLYLDKSRDIFFGGDHMFHDLQVEVTYRHRGTEWAEWNAPIPPSSVSLMPQLMTKLRAKTPITVCLLGDSISAGLNASGATDALPHQPPYGSLVAHGLEARFGAKIDYTNFSVSGMSTPWGIEQAPLVGQKKPDLVLIAFGMNDASGKMAPKTFVANIEKIMTGVREESPDTTFVLVSTMEGNADWLHASPALYVKFRDALQDLVGPKVVLADMTSVWRTLMEHKKFADLTGNGVNHPNDFTHRIYAQVVLALFAE
jgi:acyl-CoA thioesterase I